MRILLLAPEPFYQERGTPIAINNLLGTMSEYGKTVDVITYHEGADVQHPGIELHRIRKPPLVQNIRPGFSWQKVVADLFMVPIALRLLKRYRYRYIHAVEESVFIALVLKGLFGIPYVYDMDSSLAQQMIEKVPALGILSGVFEYFEGMAVQHASVVVPVCDALADTARKYQPAEVVVLRDVPVTAEAADEAPVDELREDLGIDGLLVMYVGNLESYQGIDLLLDSVSEAAHVEESFELVIIGGVDEDIAQYRAKADRLGITSRVHFVGPRPVAHLAAYLDQADILVSPRIMGENTPMKIYSYLNSGQPVLATNLWTHTQVLSDDVAVLADPTPSAYAEGLMELLRDGALRERLGSAGQELISEKYNRRVFSESVGRLLKLLEQQGGGE